MEDGIVKDLLDDAGARMDKSVEATKHEFGSVRTGRASPSLLDRVQVDYYGAVTPLRQLANVAASEARLLTITPYDKSSIKSIEKAILESDVGLTPSNDGNVIRLVIPELTEERRKDLAKVVRRIAEEGRVGVRNVRHDVQRDLRELKSEGEVGADDEHRAEDALLKQTVRDAVKLDLLELTVYAFSTENWTRPRWEVEGLMSMFAELIESETPELDEEGVRMRFIGRREGVSRELLERMAWAEEVTAGNTRMTLYVAFNYGGRAEILDAARRFDGEGDEDAFAKLLYAPEMNDPDILIRTSG